MKFFRILVSLLILPVSVSAQDAVLSGTGIATPTYDDTHGGWDTEQVADATGDQLDQLNALLTDPKATAKTFIDPSFRGTLLRPSNLKTVFEDTSVQVARMTSPGKATHNAVVAIASLTKRMAFTKPPKVKLKTVGVTLKGTDATTKIEVRYHGHTSTNQAVQVNARWSTHWKRQGDSWRMTQLLVEDYEETLTKTPQALFADLTGGVLGKDSAFQKQLAPGLDHWLARLDTRTGVKVGGWNGLAIGDANGDGLEDVYVCQGGGLPNRLFLAQADGTVKDIAAAAGVDWLETSRGALFIDLDNDGDQDLVVAVSEGLMIQENDGQGRFTVRSAEVLPFAVPYSLAAADYDDDGDLDVFAACYDRRGHVDRNVALARPVPYHDANNGGRNALLRNEGSFRFRHVTKSLGLDENNTRYSYAATWSDYDRDGDLDLYVANDFGRNNLFRQDRQGSRIRFVDVAEAAGVLDIAAGMSASWGDVDNDGWPDLYVSNMFSSAGNRIVSQGQFLNQADKATKGLFLRHARGNSLFKNLSGEGFQDISEPAAVTQGRWAWGSVFADLNNDGWEDIVVANGFITQEDTGDL